MSFAIVLTMLISLWPLANAGRALVVSQGIESPDAIVMLASHEWERLPATRALARQHPDAMVLLTVPRLITAYNCHLCGQRKDWLVAQGVDASRIRLLPDRSMNTHEEALTTRTYAARVGIRRLLIVTSPYHTGRAWLTFSHVFRETPVALGIVGASEARAQPARWWLRAYDRAYVPYEWAARVKYRFAYGIPLLKRAW